VKADLRGPVVFAGVIGLLLGERVVRAWVVPRLRTRRANPAVPAREGV
jgi:hypothetical protein